MEEKTEKRVRRHRAFVGDKFGGEPEQYDWLEIDGQLVRIDCITTIVAKESTLLVYADIEGGPLGFTRYAENDNGIARDLAIDVRRAIGIAG